MEIAAFVLSILAFVVSFISWTTSKHYSDISLIHTVQDLMLQKAKDCNLMYFEAWRGAPELQESLHLRDVDVVSEIIISFQLLDNILANYSLKKKETFFLRQLWTQLSTSIRSKIKKWDNIEKYHTTTQQQIRDIQTKFKPYF